MIKNITIVWYDENVSVYAKLCWSKNIKNINNKNKFLKLAFYLKRRRQFGDLLDGHVDACNTEKISNANLLGFSVLVDVFN